MRSLVLAALLAAATAGAADLVAVDVGHSHSKSGATSAGGRPEFEFNLALARVVGDALTQDGHEVRLIGADGEMDVLTERTRAAAGADFFLSIHHDSVQPQYLPQAGRFAGYSLFVSRKNVDPAASLACATRVGDALLAAGLKPSLHHAEPIAGENRPLADAQRGIYWFDDLVVLKTATQPALLFEAGVIVNPQQEALLRQPATRTLLAQALATGLHQCGIGGRQPEAK
ncbi:N-acetylmuramoyl-L-alanine amidase family protein [Andreprevotia lacus]|nr:N-acetylmuramoyl-L-alanine amidase [Andreprevotia lacus]